MIVSWNWLKQYVPLEISVDELAQRLTLAGLNHESTLEVEGDLAIDLEVTSNRSDCLGHLGVAREAAAVLGRKLTVPNPEYAAAPPTASELTSVTVDCPELCPRYTARIVRGARIGPSPDWLLRRLATCGVSSINNVVDITNYVLLEASQPLHAFDLEKLNGRRILVRRARPGESLVAINQKRYELDPSMCVIADAARPVAIAGVMGGFDTEVSSRTTSLLIESAEFDPLSIRRTSRTLGLSSESSYRFIRGVDPHRVDWASRRCCQLISEIAGGSVAEGVVEVGAAIQPRPPIVLRFSEFARILGIRIDPEPARQILVRLGLAELRADEAGVEVRPPSWRRDLEREIDLIEEVARIHGYEHIPEDVAVPMTTSARSDRERVEAVVRNAMIAAGFYEAITMSFVEAGWSDCFRFEPAPLPLAVDHPSRRQENLLRQSLLPSLLAVRRVNESRGIMDSEFFELARVYLPTAGPALPEERTCLGVVSGRDPRGLKGVLEELLAQLHSRARLETEPIAMPDFTAGEGAELRMGGQNVGLLGRLSDALVARFELRENCSVAQLDLAPLLAVAQLVPQYRPVPNLPGSQRELSLIVDEPVAWATVERVVREAAGPQLEEIFFNELYRGHPIAPGKKSLHFSLMYRAADRTLTREEVEQAQQAVIEACKRQLGAELRRR